MQKTNPFNGVLSTEERMDEFRSGCQNCRELIKEHGEQYAVEFYCGKYLRINEQTPPLVKAYWRGYYFVLRSLGNNVSYK